MQYISNNDEREVRSDKDKISYETQQELDRLIQILEPYILSLKTVKQKDERYLKAYVKLKLKGESNNEI